MKDSTNTQPAVLIINDDRSLLNSRRMLLEDCGAQVFTARGVKEAIQETLHDPVDLVVIDVTNVGLEHGVMLCELVKGIHPSQCVALLVKPEMGRRWGLGSVQRNRLDPPIVVKSGRYVCSSQTRR